MTLYIRVPFGTSGDKTAIPVTGTSAGPVNYTYGFGTDYSLPRDTDPAALNVERVAMNEVLYDITSNVQQYQQFGTPNFISTSDNGGSAFQYAKGSRVRYDNGSSIDIYVSLVDSNNQLPTVTANWIKTNGNTAFLNQANIFTAKQTIQLTSTQLQIGYDVSNYFTTLVSSTGSVTFDAFGSGAGFTFADSVTASSFIGSLTGNVIGNVSGSSGSTTGNASTATALQTARAINGVNFDGTAAITVTAAAGTLTGATLASNVLASSLTSVGTLSSLTIGGTLALGANSITMTGSIGTTGARLTKGWFTDLEVTNSIIGSITGNSATSTLASTLTISNDITTNASVFLVWSGTNSSANSAKVSSSKLYFNPSTGQLSSQILESTVTTGTAPFVVSSTTLVANLRSATSGSATILSTARAIYGNNFDGSADLNQIIASTYGGTGNGFTKFSGPSASEKTFTLPNASASILTDNASVTVAQGGTGRATSTTAYGLIAAGTTATGALQTLATGATTDILVGGGASALPVWTTSTGTGSPVRATSPSLTTPNIGVASATSVNFGGGALSDYIPPTAWTPVLNNWTNVGTPTVSGTYMKIGKMIYVTCLITPSTTISTAAGTSTITGLPGSQVGSSGGAVANDTSGGGFGQFLFQGTAIYPPTISATGSRLCFSGCYIVS